MKYIFEKAIIGGLIAALAKDLIQIIASPFLRLKYWDYAGLLAFDSRPSGIGETIFAVIIQTFFAIGASILIVYIEPVFKYPKRYVTYPLLSGALWFVLRAFVILSRNKEFVHKTVSGAAINVLTAFIFGLALALVINILDRKSIGK